MAEQSLGSSRKKALQKDMASARRSVSAAANKVSRLRRAASSMEHSLLSLKHIKKNIEDFEVVPAKWKGEEQEGFEGKYDSYEGGLDVYDTETSRAKQQIDEDLEQAIWERRQAEARLGGLQTSMSHLD